MSLQRRHRILVVDDEPLVCESVAMLLAHDGHDVETAASGEEALSKQSSGRFDVVITDFSMPGMKGDQLSAVLKERAPSLPVIMLTAFPPPTRPVSIDLVLTKPFFLDTLREGLRHVLKVAAV
jgi:two-component system cell cycle sensor histidine kinase/response regulator CckA